MPRQGRRTCTPACSRAARFRSRITHYPRLDDGELYDLENDPGELTNLFHSPAHRALRDDYLRRLQEKLAEYPMPDPGPAPAPF